jgi:hypothetical protein
MRRKDAVKKLRIILEEWDSCRIDIKAASAILKRIQKEIGMLPPDKNAHLPAPEFIDHSWEGETK